MTGEVIQRLWVRVPPESHFGASHNLKKIIKSIKKKGREVNCPRKVPGRGEKRKIKIKETARKGCWCRLSFYQVWRPFCRSALLLASPSNNFEHPSFFFVLISPQKKKLAGDTERREEDFGHPSVSV